MTQPHIPGPWHVEQNEDGLVIHSDDGTEICEVTGQTFDEYAEEETEANAKLIAAAPELLDALKMAECVIENYKDELDEADEDVPALAEIRAAIAKATGA
jgi:hypothetical protein